MTRPCPGASNPKIPLMAEHTVSHFLMRLCSGVVVLAPAKLLEAQLIETLAGMVNQALA